MFLLILDSVGSTELLFILVIALIFFGPRKLPQISRSLGKNIAEFRRASEDFKRTWEREVELEAERESQTKGLDLPGYDGASHQVEGSEPDIKPIPAESVIARQSGIAGESIPTPEIRGEWPEQEPLRKRDWL